MTHANHEYFMKMALGQAVIAADAGEVPAGCVIVLDKPGAPHSILGRAHNQVETLKDPTAHAEMIAITQAASTLGDWRLNDTTLYVTKEPCPMCAGAIVHARISTVVFGVPDPSRGGAISLFNILDNPALNHRCAIIGGVMADDCRQILQEFFRQRRAGKPGDSGNISV